MLSSRYLHLHQALGLGPMWLKRSAKVLPSEAPSAPDGIQTADPNARHVTAPDTPSVPPHDAGAARAAALAAVQRSRAPQMPERNISPPPAAVQTAVQTEAVLPEPAAAAVRLMVLSICPTPDDLRHGRLFSGEDGILLDNMLAAIGLSREDICLSVWLPHTTFRPDPPLQELAAALPKLHALLAAGQPAAVLLLGKIFEQPQTAPLIEQLCGGLPVFTLPHPARLLRRPQLKAQAWQTLKQLIPLLEHTAAPTRPSEPADAP